MSVPVNSTQFDALVRLLANLQIQYDMTVEQVLNLQEIVEQVLNLQEINAAQAEELRNTQLKLEELQEDSETQFNSGQ